MLLQSTTISKSPLHDRHISLSSTLSHSLSSFPPGFRSSTFLRTVGTHKSSIVRCSISQVHSYGTVDYEKRPMPKWSTIYRRISFMEDPEMGAASVLNRCEKEGKRVTKWEIRRIIKELRKFKRYQFALEVYEWMNNRAERFKILTSDSAVQLDLISKVHGISKAEDYFMMLPDSLKDKRTYGSLLNAYVQANLREKAESLLEKMKGKGYISHPLPFNVMMTLYMNLKEYDKVDMLVLEMRDKSIPLDIYSYNIWLSSCGAQGSVERMEQAFEQMKLERTINPNWATYSTMATMYIKLGQLEKAEDSLRRLEGRITGRDRIPYHFVISLYGSVGKKEEVYRVWNVYKSIFPSIPNLGYHSMISSLIRLGDIEGAEQLYDEWLSVKSNYEPRIINLLMGWYVRKGLLEKAEALFDQMVEQGGKANSGTWEILAEGHIRERRISEALSFLKEAFSVAGSKNWKPKPVNVSSILKMCEQEGDQASKDVLVGLLSQAGCLEDKVYMSYIPLTNGVPTSGELDDGDGAEMLLKQFQESL
ncbi:Pentatricopeptide repeat-containing protein [Actinidia chinensis var. chinensis]|uniref:Pentatricopeptide repeat-containing protein n=1 Tax=Actinidia chinensis var. chinensis TaxID=1590841 RepID=A0A2R6QL40_ACTCC|nr:Pentatricopeptide repeat-containing protein [Actinidia chinensis var. chinensis]